MRDGSEICTSATISNASITGLFTIGENAKIVHGVTIHAGKQISIGDYSIINGPNTTIANSIHKIKIGRFCSIARNVDIQEYNHCFKGISTHFVLKHVHNERNQEAEIYSNGPIEIGNDVWISTQSVILGGVSIGNGAIIAAKSLVNKDVPPYAIVGGSPAKVIGYRFAPEIIAKLQEIRWWDWDTEKLLRNKAIFTSQELKLSELERIV